MTGRPTTEEVVDRLRAARRELADRYVHGAGIEIGPLHQPLEVPADADVRYVDRLRLAELREHYPELAELELVDPDVVDDAETLGSISDRSQDFVIANHLLEHTENPLLALTNMLRVVKPGGIVYLAVPDKRFTFDVDRPRTPLAHVVADLEHGPERSRRGHFEEWVRDVNKTPEAELEAQVEALLAREYSIHFHVWTFDDVVELLRELRSRSEVAFDVEVAARNGPENVFVLRRTA